MADTMTKQPPAESASDASEAGFDAVSCSLELLWQPRERRTRGPQPALSLDAIVDAAIALTDREGLDALSMRRMAGELGTGTMSLYRYVPRKSVLINLMLERVSDPGDVAARYAGLDWRGVLEANGRETRELYLKHPWLLQVNWSRPLLGPNSLIGIEFLVSRLDGLGLTDQERVTVLSLIDSYVLGSVRTEILHARAVEETGVGDEEFWARQLPFLERAMASGRYPAMAALAEDTFGMGWAETFEWGLARMLDGVEALVTARRLPAGSGGDIEDPVGSRHGRRQRPRG